MEKSEQFSGVGLRLSALRVLCGAFLLFLTPGCASLAQAGRDLQARLGVAPSAVEAPTVEGVVFENLGGRLSPLAGVDAALWAPGADPADAAAQPLERRSTDTQGRFRMQVPAGWEGREALLSFRKAGYLPHEETWLLPERATGETLVVVVSPEERGGGSGVAGRDEGRVVRSLPAPDATRDTRPVQGPFGEMDTALAQPLVTARSNGLHFLVLIPPFEGTDVLPVGRTAWETRSDFANGRFEGSRNGTASRIKGTYSEFDLRWRHGLMDNLELRAWLPMGGRDGELRISTFNRAVIPEGNSDLALGDLVLGTRYAAFRSVDGVSALCYAMHLKVPTGSRDEVMSTGGTDLALDLSGTQYLAPFLAHADLGVTFTGEEKLLRQRVVLDQVYSGAAGLTLPLREGALLVQLEGNTNAFGSLGAVQDSPISLHLGGRRRYGRMVFEAGLGLGMTDAASDLVGTIGMGLRY